MDRSALRLMLPPRYTTSFVWLHTWPAASYNEYDSGHRHPLRALTHDLSLASDTARPNAVHMATITPSSFSAARAIARRFRHVSVKHAPKRRRQDWLSRGCFPPPLHPSFLLQVHQASTSSTHRQWFVWVTVEFER